MRFDPSIVTVKQSSIFSQIVSSPVVLSKLVLLDLVNKSFVRHWLLSVTVNINSPIQDYVHPDDQTQPTFEMTPGFKPFTVLKQNLSPYNFWFICFYDNS